MIKRPRHPIEIERLDEDGAGVGRVGERAMHVPFVLPGEQALIEVEHESPHAPAAWGRLVDLLRASPDRVETTCAAWGRCGGCVLQHLAYPAQLEFKRALVSERLHAAGVEAPVDACVPTPAPGGLGYRNRAKLVFAREGERVILGAYAARTHRVVDLAGCAVVAAPIDAIARRIAHLATALGVRVFDERSGEGDARYALLRASSDGRVQVMLVVARRGGRGIAELARSLCAEEPAVIGVVENLQTARGNALIGREEDDIVLAGQAVLVERGGPDMLHLSPRSFGQAGWQVAFALYRAAVAAGEPADGETVLDLFAGVGGIALRAAAAAPAATVIAVEDLAEACADARAAAAGHANLAIEHTDVTRFLATRAAAGARADLIFVDPPRKGLASSAVDAMAALSPRRIVYVSCDPGSLARDLALLAAAGYPTVRVTPYDMLPHTPHVEALAVLDRR